MTIFQYDAQLLARFPTIHGGMIVAEGLHNPASTSDLLTAYTAEQASIRARWTADAIANIPSIAAWRRAFTAFGVKPTQYRNAAEALLRRVVKQGDIPTINTLVDIGNLVSIRYALPLCVVDLDAVQGAITARFADGTETFSDLGESETLNPDVGEVIFADDQGAVIARRWCWRQSRASAVHAASRRVLVTIEGHHATAPADITAAMHDVVQLLGQYAGARDCQAILLNATQPSFGRA